MGFNVVGQIYNGAKNYIIPKIGIEELAKNRFEICLKCEHLTTNNRCRKCGCFMTLKTRSEKAKCPLNYW